MQTSHLLSTPKYVSRKEYKEENLFYIYIYIHIFITSCTYINVYILFLTETYLFTKHPGSDFCIFITFEYLMYLFVYVILYEFFITLSSSNIMKRLCTLNVHT